MSTNSKKSIKEMVLLSLGAVIVGSSIVFGFAILGKECSRLITNPIFYPSAWR